MIAPSEIERAIDIALAEDLAGGDITSEACVPEAARARARLQAKQDLVVCGVDVAARTFARLDPACTFRAAVADGDRVASGEHIATVEGGARALLAAERTALNFLQRLSGVATLTAEYVAAADGRCRIVDTRKTTPGLRALQRFAVRCGGGHNHRHDLAGGVLIKENHIRAAGGIAAAVRACKERAPHPLRVQCEITTLAELREALDAGADAVLLDNMNDATSAAAVELVEGRAIVEASGGIDLDRVDWLAAIGVDVISIGALTHSAPSADISLLFDIPDLEEAGRASAGSGDA
jgi:nicotinate-nucleotide pyrophosphorylase (carboxylating)